MAKTTTRDKHIPLYLGRSLQEWWTDFLSDDYANGMQSEFRLLFRHPLTDFFVRSDSAKTRPSGEASSSVVCQALPHFGAEFIHKAGQAFPSLDDRRQTQVVSCLAKTGMDSLLGLLHLLDHPSANVRMAACMSLADVVAPADPMEGNVPSYVLRLQEAFLRNPRPSQDEADAIEAYMDAKAIAASRCDGENAEVAAGLVKKLEDEYPSVRLAAAVVLSRLLGSHRKTVAPALFKSLTDACQLVRIAAMNAFGIQVNPAATADVDDTQLYELMLDPESHLNAMIELGDRWITNCLRRLETDPSQNICEKLAEVATLCETGKPIHNLRPQDASDLIQTLEGAEPVDGHDLVARQEAVWALQWLIEQWQYVEQREADKDKPKRGKDKASCPASVRRMQKKIGQLAKAPLAEVAAALHDRDIALRLAALKSLPRLSSTGDGVVDYVVNMFKDPCQQVRWKAQRMLQDMALCKAEQVQRFPAPVEVSPLYFGRSLEQWWADFLAAEYIDDMESACQMLFPYLRPLWSAKVDFANVCKDLQIKNFVCQALPCFGEAFVQRAMDAFPNLEERKQVRLIICIAATGKSSVPCLVQLLSHSSANVRMAACFGLADVIDPWEGEHSPELLQLQKEFLLRASESREDADAYIAAEAALQDALSIEAEVPSALIDRLEDDYRPVRLAAVGALSYVLHGYTVEGTMRDGIVTALAKRLQDSCQSVRITAMKALANENIQRVSLATDDTSLYQRQFDTVDRDGREKALIEMAYNEALDCLQRLVNDVIQSRYDILRESLIQLPQLLLHS